MAEVMQISKSDLAGARDTGNKEFIEVTFKKAAQTIRAGGTVHLMQVFSDAHKEIADVIENKEQLERFKTIYLR
jgi:hypothetical protein